MKHNDDNEFDLFYYAFNYRNAGTLDADDWWKALEKYVADNYIAKSTKDEYERQNPLGGPATMFVVIGSRIRAGEPLDDVMRDYGLMFVDREPPL